ncbi:MAG: glycosyltransferase [Syntrophobacteraceae bacterium]
MDSVPKLSVVVPCYNEERTLAKSINRVLQIADNSLSLEIIIVDDGSKDGSLAIANSLQKQHPETIVLLRHDKNQGKGASLRTGFKKATGDFVAIQDADLEYNPQDLRKLIVPLIENDADVVLGSRFLSYGAHRVIYFWHYVGNSILTLLSNMFTDLNLTDMETCYKVFKREVIEDIEIHENRFGFEPEIVAKIAHKRLRIYEMGISYYGRTYEEGKKIGVKDGFRALYCIMRYNGHKAPVPIQFLVYLFIGGLSAIVNLAVFLFLFALGFSVITSALSAFVIAAIVNYFLSILLLFKHKAKWNSITEVVIYALVVCATAFVDVWTTNLFLAMGWLPASSKIAASFIGLVLNYTGRKVFVFPERPLGSWKPQVEKTDNNAD